VGAVLGDTGEGNLPFGGIGVFFFIALDEAVAADDEEPPSDTARENHGDDAGECHVGLIGFMGFVETG